MRSPASRAPGSPLHNQADAIGGDATPPCIGSTREGQRELSSPAEQHVWFQPTQPRICLYLLVRWRTTRPLEGVVHITLWYCVRANFRRTTGRTFRARSWPTRRAGLECSGRLVGPRRLALQRHARCGEKVSTIQVGCVRRCVRLLARHLESRPAPALRVLRECHPRSAATNTNVSIIRLPDRCVPIPHVLSVERHPYPIEPCRLCHLQGGKSCQAQRPCMSRDSAVRQQYVSV
jgi:hypothetical protein